MLEDVLIFLKIPRSANNLRLKAKSEGNDQSILKGSAIFEDEYICYFLKADDLV